MSSQAERYSHYGITLKGRLVKMRPRGVGFKTPPPPKERPMNDKKNGNNSGLALRLGSL